MSVQPYRVYAIRYGERQATTSEAFYRDYRNEPLGMTYYVWALTNGQHTLIVDSGFGEAGGTKRGRTFLRSPDRGLAEIGIDAGQVEHVVISHFHYDHVGGHALFPKATFYLQEAEMAFYTGPNGARAAFQHSVDADDVCAMIRLNYAGRVAFVNGEREILPGISVHWVGGHTAGMQIVSVQTARGRAVVASDASHYYRNFQERIPFNTLHDIPGTYRAFERILGLADTPDLAIPGHDPLVLKRLRPVADGIVEL
jgi:glyoxylase-like metal-dependent hydrolase (beta-lactamase superfamily II)